MFSWCEPTELTEERRGETRLNRYPKARFIDKGLESGRGREEDSA